MLVNGKKLLINEIDKDKDNDNDTIDIERNFFKEISISMKETRRAKLCSDKEAESGANRYIKLLNAPECKNFFLKVMYHLPYDTRERILESSVRPWITTPKKYFTHCAKRELENLGF